MRIIYGLNLYSFLGFVVNKDQSRLKTTQFHSLIKNNKNYIITW